ncbi:hypothetical protein GCM10009093_12030 [Brevundimonas terrae]|uniref:Uncharacterized protein n=1 Tax=Brevundimonas terrae TaxID=363631 RepID=A0ABN0Y8S2_9CAUL
MRILNAVIVSQWIWTMKMPQFQLIERSPVRSKPVRRDAFGLDGLVAQKPSEQFQSRLCISSTLNDYV